MSNETKTNSDEVKMPLWQHLDDLRGALFRCLIAISLASTITYLNLTKIVFFLEQPLLNLLPENERHLYFTGITEKFFVYFKVCIYSAIALVLPYLLFEIWKFVAPGLYSKERRFLLPFLSLGTIAFYIGLTFCYYVVIPLGYDFLIKFGSESDKAMITLSEYFSITLQMLIGLGLVFELPVLMMLLAKFGIISHQILKKIRPQAYIALAVLSAIITPSPDAISMVLVLVPLCLLYEFGAILVQWVVRHEP